MYFEKTIKSLLLCERGFILHVYEVHVMLTEFGKQLRDIRLRRNLLL